MKRKTQKIIAILLLILMFINAVPISTFATFITDMNSNAQFGVIGGSKENYGHELHYANYDGTTYLVFCANYGAPSADGSEYGYNGDFIVHYKNSLPQYEKVAEMIYFGYTMNYGVGLPTTPEAMRAACCTQQWVWEYIHNNIDGNTQVPDRESWNGNYMSTGHLADWTTTTENYYNQYHGNVSFNGTTNKVTLGQSTVINDTTGRLASYQSFSHNVNGVTFSHTQGNNALVVSVDSNCSADNVTFNSRDYGLYQLMPNGSNYNSSTMGNYIYIQFTSGQVQNLMFSNYVDPSCFSISVEIEYGNTLIVKTNSNGNLLAGCTFDLYTDVGCTQRIRTGVSDENGNIYFRRLAPGSYYIREKSVPNGYLLDTTVQKVEVRVNETAEISFKNYEPTGELKIIKTDAETGNENRADGIAHHGDASLAETEYTLYAREDIYNVARTVKYFSKDEQIATYTFNANGIAKINISTNSKTANLKVEENVLKGLPMGNYYAQETKVPTGYLKDNETHNIVLKYKDMHTRIIKSDNTFSNKVQKAKFEVIKVSSITNTTAPILENAEFTAILTKYVKYYGSFEEAIKHLDEFSKDEYSVFKTEVNGHGISGLLSYGEYTVHETYCPSNLVNPVKPFKVVIDKDSPNVIKELVENDTPFESYIKLIKQDKNTGKLVTLNNTTFSLYKLNEENNKWERVSCKLGKESFDTWTTDKNATAYTETKLVAGKYKVDEIKVADGFLQLDEECIFEVNRSNETLEYDKDYDAYISVVVENEQPTGILVVNKTVKLRDDVDTTLIKDIDFTKISFELKASQDIIDMADGSVIYKKDEVIGTYGLNSDGTLKIDNLPMGSYKFYEVSTIEGAVLDKTIYDVVFEQKDTTTKVYPVKLNIENDTTIFEFSKKAITGDDELEGATLTVLDKDNNIIDTWISGKGSHKIEGLKVGENYILREDITPDEYVQATDISFSVKDTKEIQKVEMIDKILEISKQDIGGKEIEGATLVVTNTRTKNIVDKWVSTNEPHKVSGLIEGETYVLYEEIVIDGYVKATDIEFTVSDDKETQKVVMIDKVVEVVKTDFVTGEEIEGAELQVVDEDGNIIDEWVSTKEAHKVKGLEENKNYQLIEKTCPYGYEIAKTITFTVTEDKETQKVEMKDMPILTDVKLIKVDSKTKERIFEDFTFGIYVDENCTELIEEKHSNKETGTITFEDLRYGTFYVKELLSPKNYSLSDKVVKIEINDKGVFVDEEHIGQDEDGIYSFEFENQKIETPKTRR